VVHTTNLSTALHRDDRVAVVTLSGEADLAALDQLREILAEARTLPDIDSIQVDLAELRFIDSSGIGSLIAGHRMAVQDGLGFSIVRPAPAVRSVLAMTGVLGLLTGNPADDDDLTADWV